MGGKIINRMQKSYTCSPGELFEYRVIAVSPAFYKLYRFLVNNGISTFVAVRRMTVKTVFAKLVLQCIILPLNLQLNKQEN